jgi:hypothetical protein
MTPQVFLIEPLRRHLRSRKGLQQNYFSYGDYWALSSSIGCKIIFIVDIRVFLDN